MSNPLACAFCGEDVSIKTAWSEIVGWTHPRVQGGTNSVSLRLPTGRLACNRCVQLRRAGAIPEEQGRLV